jgi:hypothetical protein
MKLLINVKDLANYRSREYIPLRCEHCSNDFLRMKKDVQSAIKGRSHCSANFCSKRCSSLSRENKVQTKCKQCGDLIVRKSSSIRSENIFCSLTCSGLYNSQHKTKGSNRSKLEKWIQSQLEIIYPNLIISYNDKEAINAELDIFIPSLNLAFELNGIFHYEPIFGEEQLDKTKSNDKRKFSACSENGISLCIIDTSKQKYFKEASSKEFLDIITRIINENLAAGIGNDPT